VVPEGLGDGGTDASRETVLVICGATGSGKGALALSLARRFDGEIVYADSRKIYRGLDVGTAKPAPESRASVPHHMLDLIEPGERYDAHRYAREAAGAIAGIRSRRRLPIVVGGTGLYLRALLRGLIETPPRDPDLRERLKREEEHRPGCLHARLERCDPEAARRIPPSDRVRLIRALEVLLRTGKPISVFQRQHGFTVERYRSWQVAIAWPLAELYRRIDARAERMLASGLVEEVRRIRQGSDADRARSALQVLGYRQVDAHLQGQIDRGAALQALQRAHRRYARRQLAWFRRDPGVRWLPAPPDLEALSAELTGFLASAE
jgi:tRNA dimethylallyltransferase